MKVISNATVFCPVLGLIENAKILFDDKKIHAVGKTISVPKHAEKIDATGKYVLPGFIDAHTHHGLFDGSIGWAGEDGNEKTAPCTPEVRGIDAFNPFESSLKDLLIGGVTCINVGPGSGNVIAGEDLVIKPVGTVVDEMIVLCPSGLKVALGENPKRVHGKQNRMPATRMGVAALLRKTFTNGHNYIKEWNSYETKYAEAKKKKKAPPIPPKHDLGMETIAKVLRKEIPVHAHAHRADDISTIIRIADEFKIKLTIIHCTEGHKIADYIASKGVAAVVGPTMYRVSKPETQERSFKTAVVLYRSRVKVALQTDSITPMNYFPLLPMYTIKNGLTHEEALRCVTVNPAEILGIGNRVGSLQPGKDADIVIWSGHPFDFYSKVEKVFINGKEAYSA
ncbi:MAG: amidohydrolase [Deltaproteobacteria bacterium]|nr:amidohydrolase [Deltaproteobacteria bacterium]